MKMYKVMFHFKPHNIYGQVRRMDQDEDMYTYEEYLDMVKSNNDPRYEYFVEETA